MPTKGGLSFRLGKSYVTTRFHFDGGTGHQLGNSSWRSELSFDAVVPLP
jgi:hypothetical protein